MPRVRRRALARNDVLSDKAKVWLETGHDLLWFATDCTEEDLPELWERFGEEILADHIAQHPGSRPWGWWRWSAPEAPRLVESGGITILDVDNYYPWPEDLDPHQQYETERDYLERLGLLTDAERAALAAK
jgi:hypothetical protein